MTIFLFLIFLILLLAIILYDSNYKNKKLYSRVYLCITFISLLIVSGCRGLSIGTDTNMYVRAFNAVKSIQDMFVYYVDRFEVGYRFFNVMIKQLSDNPHLLLFFSSVLILLMTYYFFYKESKYPWMSLLMFVGLMYYSNSMCLLRQYLAIGFVFLAIVCLEKQKRFKFLGLVILASLFHSSAIITILLYPLMKIEFTNSNRRIIIAVALISTLFANQLINLVIRIVPKYTSYLTSDKYYLENQIGTILKAILQFLFFVFVNYSYKRNYENNKSSILKIGYYCSLLSCVISFVSINGAILDRMAVYFSIINCITIPNMIFTFKSINNRRLFVVILIIICLSYYIIILVYRPYWSGIIPYVFWE